jgi:D-alanyl-D-alanine carboxypeptidase/D-alanyl-D-alanine-endopeptidase (penicillin-binding protein 4)
MIFALVSVCISAATTGGLYSWSNAEVDRWLKQHAAIGQTFDARLAETVAVTLGTPYDDGPLGEGPGAPYDSDPLIDLTRVDCVTYIEQAVALASSSDLKSATEFLQQIRYKGGKVDYASRNHFLEADWLRNNAWCKDVSGSLGLETVALTRTIDRADFFRRTNAPSVGQRLPVEQVTIHYLPNSLAQAAEAKLPDGCIVAFVGKVDWLFSLHCGIWLNGKLHHASSKSGKAVAMDLSDYVDGQANRYLGFIAYKINPPKP